MRAQISARIRDENRQSATRLSLQPSRQAATPPHHPKKMLQTLCKRAAKLFKETAAVFLSEQLLTDRLLEAQS